MVDDDHENTLCLVTGKYKLYWYYKNVNDLNSSKEVVTMEVYNTNKGKHTTRIILQLTKVESLYKIFLLIDKT